MSRRRQTAADKARQKKTLDAFDQILAEVRSTNGVALEYFTKIRKKLSKRPDYRLKETRTLQTRA